MKCTLLFAALSVFILISGCEQKAVYTVTVKNTLDVSRSFETVEINKADIVLKKDKDFSKLVVQDIDTKAILISQFVDEDLDGEVDVLLFQPEVGAKSDKQYELVVMDQYITPEIIEYCYSRFVPERTDDYAWENNRVAFRTFGPTAQKMKEDGVLGGTLSSGIDAWLKRVDYPIINAWYDKTIKGTGSYHEDTGEGLDNFHVGASRGVGGIAIKKDTSFYVSKNFSNWQIITTGPIRTSFVLEYANWDANGQPISEKKYISLDYGSNLSKFKTEIFGTHSFYSGLTLHENDGNTVLNEKAGWICYWEPHEDSELGTAIVVPDGNMLSSELSVSTLKDQSNFFAEIQVNNNIGVYYAGFGWKKSEQFETQESWENYLNDFALKANNPLKINFR